MINGGFVLSGAMAMLTKYRSWIITKSGLRELLQNSVAMEKTKGEQLCPNQTAA
jgi:hypothetical protein